MASSNLSASGSWRDWLRLVLVWLVAVVAVLVIAGVVLYYAIGVPRSGLPTVNGSLVVAAGAVLVILLLGIGYLWVPALKDERPQRYVISFALLLMIAASLSYAQFD